MQSWHVAGVSALSFDTVQSSTSYCLRELGNSDSSQIHALLECNVARPTLKTQHMYSTAHFPVTVGDVTCTHVCHSVVSGIC